MAPAYKLRTEFANLTSPELNMEELMIKDRFPLSLDIFASDKFQIGGAMTHTGEKFQARNGQKQFSKYK